MGILLFIFSPAFLDNRETKFSCQPIFAQNNGSRRLRACAKQRNLKVAVTVLCSANSDAAKVTIS